MNDLDRPIFVVGAARSGTTMLAHILRRHSRLAFLDEPNHIWRYGNEGRDHDVLTPDDLSENIARHIRQSFARFVYEQGKERLLDKTPHNSLRMEFVAAVFPNGKFVHMIRDGRDVALSAARQWRGGVGQGETRPPTARVQRLWKRTRKLWAARGEALRHAPRVYLRKALVEWARVLFPHHTYVWGPRFPGIEAVARTYSLLETCAIQWDWCVRAAMSAGRRMGDDQYLEVRFEEFLAHPEEHTRRILAFLELEPEEDVIQFARASTNRANAGKWRHLPAEDVERIVKHIAPTLAYLGYLEDDV